MLYLNRNSNQHQFNMKFLKYVFLFLIITSNKNVLSQEYSSPLDFNLLLSGTFGELRSNHFHSGIDIKTEGVEGQRIHAISDGYVSRIKVSTSGYGKAIYITHPKTGHTSVYAHLKKFSKKIDDVVKKEHYLKERFEINIFLQKDKLKIKQGELIAFSGNSGGSNGAHLHFEIRDSKSEHPINPLKFKFDITDNIPPTLKKIKIYVFDTTLVNGYNNNKVYPVVYKNNKYTLAETPEINGSFALGIFTYDKADNAYNKNGVYCIKLFVDSLLYYQFEVNELNFNTTRFINAHIDYCENKLSGNKYHRCYKLQNNKLSNYSNLINNGIISFNDTLLHLVKIEVSDIFGNQSEVNFNIKSLNMPFLKKCILKTDSFNQLFSYSKTNTFSTQNIKINMPAYSLYEKMMFKYSNNDSLKGVYGLVHSVHNQNTPVHKKYTLSLKANVTERLKNKTYIAKTDQKGKFWYRGGSWENDFITTKVREFGDFCIIADTISPEIKGINIFPDKEFNTQTTIKLTIKDTDSGIKSYRAEIDGKWILMDYDYKKNLLRYDIENNISEGKHDFNLKVIDKVGNETNYIANFIY